MSAAKTVVASDDQRRAQSPSPEKKAKPGASWKNNETHVVPKNKLPIVFGGLMLCVFLAALDQVASLFLTLHPRVTLRLVRQL